MNPAHQPGFHAIPSCAEPRAKPAATRMSRPQRSCLTLLALALATPACLVISTPDVEPPKRTAPFLVAATADPDPRNVLIVDDAQLGDKESVDFSAHVVSEDDGKKVRFRLYIDYGAPDNLGGQLSAAVISNITPLNPGTVTDMDRVVKATWYPNSLSPGTRHCHTVTLIASHEFDDTTGCPVCRNDSSQITWQVYRCDSGPSCVTDFSECQMWTRSCPSVVDTESAEQCGVTP
jgi:hypothetical protein